MQQQYHLHQSWLWLLLLPLLSLSSCSGADTDDAGNLPAASAMPISFTALSKWDEAQAKSSTSPHTRLSEDATTKTLSFDKNDAIGVFAYLNSSDTPNFMNNQKVTYDGANWNYSPVKYWPNNEADKLSFYAYYPHRESSDGDTIKAISSSNDKLTINYCCPNANIDLMASEPVSGLTYTSGQGKVPLKFQHLLARVKFTFTYEGKDDYRPVIHVLKYMIPRYKATVTCYTGNVESATNEVDNSKFPFVWSELPADNEPVEIERYVSDVAGEVLVEKGQLIKEFTAYLLPCNFPCSSDGATQKGSFTFSLNNVLYTYTPQNIIPVYAGKSYTVNFIIASKSSGSTSEENKYFITSYSIWADGGTINGTLE